MWWPFVCNDSGHRGPVGGIGCAGVEQLVECSVRSVTGEVVVVPGMVIARAATVVAQRANDDQVMRLLRQIRQMLTELDARSRGCDRFETAAVFFRRVRLHVPGVDVGRTTAQPDHDRGLRHLPAICCCRARRSTACEIEAEISHDTRGEERPTITWVRMDHSCNLADCR